MHHIKVGHYELSEKGIYEMVWKLSSFSCFLTHFTQNAGRFERSLFDITAEK